MASHLSLGSGHPRLYLPMALADQNTPGSRKLLVKIGEVADNPGLDHELLDSLLADLGL